MNQERLGRPEKISWENLKDDEIKAKLLGLANESGALLSQLNLPHKEEAKDKLRAEQIIRDYIVEKGFPYRVKEDISISVSMPRTTDPDSKIGKREIMGSVTLHSGEENERVIWF